MKTLAAKILGVLAAGVMALPAAAQPYRDHMGMWNGNWGWGHMMFGGLAMLLFWAAVIALIVLIVRFLSGSAREQPAGSRPALDILEERYARGEIDRDEFDEKSQLLTERAQQRKRK